MKMAKKLLAVVMVLTMVAAFTAIAFAANPSVSFAVGDYADGKATVSVKFVDCVDLTSGSLNFGYEAGKVSKVVKKNGADAKAIGDIDNGFNSEFNADTNPAEFGFYFKNKLWDNAAWAEAADELGQDDVVNGENFECAQFVFTAENGAVITVTGELKFGDTAVAVNKTFTIGTAAPAPSEKPSETPSEKPSETPSEKPSETPSEKPSETPSEKPSETPSEKPSETPTEKPTQKPDSKPTGNVDKYGKTIIAYDPLNGKAIVGYDAHNNPIYSQDPNARRSVILDDGAGVSPVDGKTGTKITNNPAATKDAKDGKTGTKTVAANVKTDGGKKTGDNGILAIVAGVVALAGAAFVVTKKRK